MRSSPRKALALMLLLAALGTGLLGPAGCRKQSEGTAPGSDKTSGAAKGRPPVPVLIATAELADVPIEQRALGTVEPVQSSPVRPQITGTITEVLFREGDMVRAGQVLFRPIMMTTMAALFGTLPLALGAGGESRRPLGLAVVGGLAFSQFITLYVTPVFYPYFDGLQRRVRRTLGMKAAA